MRPMPSAHPTPVERILVEGSNRIAVRASDIVSMDQQFRSGVHLGAVGEDQRVVAHPRIGAVRTLGDHNAPLEHTARLISAPPFGELLGYPIRSLMGYDRR